MPGLPLRGQQGHGVGVQYFPMHPDAGAAGLSMATPSVHIAAGNCVGDLLPGTRSPPLCWQRGARAPLRSWWRSPSPCWRERMVRAGSFVRSFSIWLRWRPLTGITTRSHHVTKSCIPLTLGWTKLRYLSSSKYHITRQCYVGRFTHCTLNIIIGLKGMVRSSISFKPNL